MKLWARWSQKRKIRSLGIMEDFIRKHYGFIETHYWETEIKKLSNNIDKNDIYNDISMNDDKYANALFIFYIATTTDLSWIIDIQKLVK